MKLTEEKLKQLIKEELENLYELELDMKKRSTDPIQYFDSEIPEYMKGAEGHPLGKKELKATKESLVQAIESLEVKELVIPIPENLRKKYKGHILKAIKTWVEQGEYKLGDDNFKVLRKYLDDNTIRFKEAVAENYSKQRYGGAKRK